MLQYKKIYSIIRVIGDKNKICNFLVFVEILPYLYNAINSVPRPIKMQPIRDFTVNCSCKNTKAKIRVITTLSLSIGTTFDAVPICSAL